MSQAKMHEAAQKIMSETMPVDRDLRVQVAEIAIRCAKAEAELAAMEKEHPCCSGADLVAEEALER